MADPVFPHRIRFGDFQADLVSGELRRDGVADKILLQDQPLAVLRALVSRPGEMVSREELIELLWKGNTNVDFDPSLNKAVNRLRDALGDSAEHPRYIETLSRRGYRFIAPIEMPATLDDSTGLVVRTSARRALPKFVLWVGAVAAFVLIAGFIYREIGPRLELPPITIVPFTPYPGFELCPAFSPDGSRIVFSWDDPALGGKGFDLYVKAIGSESLLRLTHNPSPHFICPAWSPDGTQIAFIRLSSPDTGLYVVPALGGPERRLRPIRNTMPTSTMISWAPSMISWAPSGQFIAFADSLPRDDHLRVALLSVATLETRQASHPGECIEEGLPAFSHSGKELAFACLLNPDDRELGIYVVRRSPEAGYAPYDGLRLARRNRVEDR